MSNAGATIPLTAPSHEQSPNRGIFKLCPAGTAANSISEALRLDEGDWILQGATLDADGKRATGGTAGFTAVLRYGAGRGVVEESVVIPGRGAAFARHFDFCQVQIQNPAYAAARTVMLQARKSLFGPSTFQQVQTVPLAAGTLLVPPLFARSVEFHLTAGDTVQELTAGGVALSPILTVPASNVLAFEISPFAEILQVTAAAIGQAVFGCAA